MGGAAGTGGVGGVAGMGGIGGTAGMGGTGGMGGSDDVRGRAAWPAAARRLQIGIVGRWHPPVEPVTW